MLSRKEKYRIFVLEDSVFIKNALMDFLPTLGFDVIGMAANEKEAYRYIAETRPHVVLLDTTLPNSNPAEIIRGILSINKKITIIVLSNLSNLNQVGQLLREGATDFIPKPLIESQVEYVLRGYEFSSGIRPRSRVSTIALVLSLFLNEILQHSPSNFDRFIKNAVTRPLKRLHRDYAERYNISLEPIRINIVKEHEKDEEEVELILKQIDRIYISVVKNLAKDFPDEYIHSLLTETYQTFYPLAKYLIDATEYELPEWNGYRPTYLNPELLLQDARFDYIYEDYYHIQFDDSELDQFDYNARIKPYKTLLKHDPRVLPKFPRPEASNIDNLDIHTLLCYFDEMFGPKASIIYPPPQGRIEQDKLNAVPRLMDLVGIRPNEPFIHLVNDYGMVNILFSVSGKFRGGARDHMLSIVISPAEVKEMVKINQMSSILRATSQLITHYLKDNPNALDQEKSSIIKSEPHKILEDLHNATRTYLKNN